MRTLVASFFGILSAPLGFSQTYPHPMRTAPGAPPQILSAPTLAPGGASPGGSISATMSFQAVDRLLHQDDFWSNILVGDANHNGRQEIVIRYVPVSGGSVGTILFYEDDGIGNFSRVFAFPLADGGLLAMGDVDGDGLTDIFFERALGPCHHEFVRREASSPNGFPDHEVWTSPKQGNVVDMQGFLADSDGDGVKEFITSDANFTCLPTSLKVFESAPLNQMTLILNATINGDIGNPVVADFDADGHPEIVVADAISGFLLDFESVADNVYLPPAQTAPHTLFNAYQLALIDRFSPDGKPMVFLAGQQGSLDYRCLCYEAAAAGTLVKVNEALVPNNCGASIPQIAAADLMGSRTPEIIVDRLCDPVPIFTVGALGALTLFETPSITESLEVAATQKSRVHSGAIAIGTYPTAANPQGKTLVLELR